jgi:biotin synthesis protein BioG
MKTYIQRREKNNRLIIVYGGWGNDEKAYTPLCSEESDFILFYNYSADEPLILPEMKLYNQITVIGWSLGVWAAEYLMDKAGIKPDLSIAINGTPLPAHDLYGIPLAEFEKTLNSITDMNMVKFFLRMFGNKETYLANIDRIPSRTVKSLSDELRWLYNRIMEQKETGFQWDVALISKNDRIFPSKNLLAYWTKKQGTVYKVLPQPHYLFHSWQNFDQLIEFANSLLNKSRK